MYLSFDASIQSNITIIISRILNFNFNFNVWDSSIQFNQMLFNSIFTNENSFYVYFHVQSNMECDAMDCCGIQSGISSVFLVLNLTLALFLRFCGNIKCRGAIWEVAPHLAWLFAIMQLALQLFYKGFVTTRWVLQHI